MKRIYIIGKITGEHPIDYERKFQRAEELLEMAGFSAVNPTKFGLPYNTSSTEAMKTCLPRLFTCDAAYVLACHRNNSRGSETEIAFCKQHGIPLFYEEERGFTELLSLMKQETI